MLPQEAIERFHSKTMKTPSGCILWTAGRFKDGYGGFCVFGKNRRAHRVAWEITNGPIQDNKMQVLHRCDDPICVNPEHLFLGTLVENMLDRDKKGRGLTGEKCGSSKLKATDIREIRQSSIPATQICKRYGVSHSTISMVRRGDTWKEA